MSSSSSSEAEHSLVTVARARRHPALSNVNTTLLQEVLQAATEAVEDYCDREFEYRSRTEVHDGKDSDTLWLKVVPVSSITSITITEADGDTEALTISTDVVYNAETGAVTFGPDNDSTYTRWPDAYPRNVSVVYVGGYTTVPDAIQQAVILVTIQILKQSGSDQPIGWKSGSMGEDRWTKWEDVQLITPAVAALLAKHRRLEF